jgi:hypothetical protein
MTGAGGASGILSGKEQIKHTSLPHILAAQSPTVHD